MKRTGFLFDYITDFDNLRLAYLKARRGKSNKQDVVEFSKNVNENLENLRNALVNEVYIMKPYRHFFVMDPKKRLISAASFEDRIIHHAIINLLEPVFERNFIFHTYGCRKGKGTLAAILITQKKSCNAKYFLKLDVKKFFDSIDHKILKIKLEKIIKDKRVLDLLGKIIDSYEIESGHSLPIGNLTSQFFANFFLSSLDHYVVEILKPFFYVRHMDDIVILENDMSKLKFIYGIVKQYCEEELHLQLKIPVFGNVQNGIPFLGCLIFHNKINILQSKRKLKKAKIKKIVYFEERNMITKEKACERITAICAMEKGLVCR